MYDKEQLIETFQKSLTAVKGEIVEDLSRFLETIEPGNVLIESKNNAPQEILDILKSAKFEILFADELFEKDSYKNVVFNNTVLGITFPKLAIADTGTVVETTDFNKIRSVSLLPPVHLSIIRPESIVPSMKRAIIELQKRYTDDDKSLRLPEVLTFITGPSRTADIEQTLTVGVHGPIRKAVYIFKQ